MASSTAEEMLREGRLDEALEQLQNGVRKQPADAKLRTFLFQLLAVRGEWKRALNQLQVIAGLDGTALPMVQAYREAIRCELLRERVFSGQSTPLAFGEPNQWFALLVESLRFSAEGRFEEAAKLRSQAYEDAPATRGTLDGQAFEWIADADSRLGPVLEVVLNGRYYWMPFAAVQRIDIEAPSDLRDVVWMPAHFVFNNGGETVGLIPTRYCDTPQSHDPLLKLARKTEWSEAGEGVYLGLGQRLLATDSGDYALMDVREIVMVNGEAS
jgi:type VI secretion system protein ImpE